LLLLISARPRMITISGAKRMSEAPAENATPAAPKGKMVPVAVGAGALLFGAVIGLFVVAPRLHSKPADGKAKTEAKAEGEGKAPLLFKLDNVIVNPAGAGGSRYVVLSVAIEVPDALTETMLRESEVQFRDAVTGVLEKQTVEQLTMVGARDSLRRRVSEAAVPFVKGAAVKVYIPQFLIQ
jgi:flagellar basal body-associated protein FliL